MSRQTQTLTLLTEENKIFYNKVLLKRLLPKLVFAKYGQKKPLPKNQGDTVNFRKFSSLSIATTPLTEGVTPDGNKLTVTSITATVKQYGDFIEVSDVLDMVGIDPVITENSELLGEQAGLTIDTLVRNAVVAGTNVHYAGGRANRNAIIATDIITGDEVKKVVRTLRKANVSTLEGGYFVGIIDPDVAYDLMSDPLWQDVSKYNGGTAIMKGEIGKIHGVRFIETTQVKVDTNSGGINVHSCMILGADAYGIVDIENSAKGKPEIIVKPLGSSGTEDPLNQRGTQGWKCMFTTVRLNELAMVRLECAATA